VASTDHFKKLSNMLPRQRFIIAGEVDAVLKNARQFNPDGNELYFYQVVLLPVLLEQDAVGDNISVMRSDGITQLLPPNTEVIVLKF
jgi:hypothetical protein